MDFKSVYKVFVFTKWCHSNQVDFWAPPIKSIADFLLYLFLDRKLQPSIIDGYRSAIANWEILLSMSAKDKISLISWIFSIAGPKGHRGIPSWNHSLVLNQLTVAPFETLIEASLHLTLKTVSLLALGFGKHRSEIMLVSTKYQTPDRLVEGVALPLNQLSFKELAGQSGPSLAPVTIPALAPTLICHSRLSGHCVQLGLCATTQAGPQAKQVLSPSRKTLTKIYLLPLCLHGSSRL